MDMTYDMSGTAPLLTKAQYAELMQTTERTVQRWLSRNRLPGAVQDGRGRWMIPADARPVEDDPGTVMRPVTSGTRNPGAALEVGHSPALDAGTLDRLPAFLTVEEAVRVLNYGTPPDGRQRITEHAIRHHQEYFGVIKLGRLLIPRSRIKEILG